ncbi:hypothetical protein FF1_004628 [Malus domestica]
MGVLGKSQQRNPIDFNSELMASEIKDPMDELTLTKTGRSTTVSALEQAGKGGKSAIGVLVCRQGQKWVHHH